MLSLFGFFSKLLVSFPNGLRVREKFAKILRKGFTVSESGTDISEENVNDQYSVIRFMENCSYVIIVCEKL